MKKSVKVIVGLMVAVLFVSCVSVCAAEAAEGAVTRERPSMFKRMDARKELTEEEKAAKIEEAKKTLAEKLAAGKITQEQYDAMLAKIEAGDFGFGFNGRNNGERPQRKELTEEEKAAKIEDAKKTLAEKLAAGKITQEQYDAMLAKIEAGDFSFGFNGRNNGERPQRKELTEEEKAAKIEDAKKALAEKLAAGKITQEQYDAMLAKIEAGDFGFGFNGRNNGERPQRKELTEEEKAAKLETMKENCKKMLDKQLADGKITQEQYDERLAKIEAGEFGFRSNGRNEAEQPKAWGKNRNKGEQPQRQQLTEEEKAAKLETMKENWKKALDEKLAAGKITQEQYDETIAKLESGEFKFPGNGFRGQRNGFGKSFGGNRQGGHRWQGKGFAKWAEQPAAQAET